MNHSPNFPVKWVFALAGVVILAAIAAAIFSLFAVPFPTVFQYRLTIFLVCFALSAIASLLFVAKAEIKATAGVMSLALGGPAVVWVAAVLLFNMVLPETPLRKEYDLNLNLVFPDDEKKPADPYNAKVIGFVQRLGDPAGPQPYKADPIRGGGGGGLAFQFGGLAAGDKIFVVVEDAGRTWRSDEMIIPSAHLKLKSR